MATRSSQNGARTTRASVLAPAGQPDRDAAPVVTDRPAAPPHTDRRRQRPDYRLRGLDPEVLRAAGTPLPSARANKARQHRRRRFVLGWVLALVAAVGTAAVLRATLFQPFSVTSTTMAPTLQRGDRVVVATSSAVGGSIGQGSIVVLRAPFVAGCGAKAGGTGDLVGRIIGLPGQTVVSRGGGVYVDGRRLRESGWFDRRFGQTGGIPVPLTRVPSHSYYVLDDNRSYGCDSRSFGPVQTSAIVGKVITTVTRDGHLYVHLY